MRTATEILRHEHEAILGMLEATEEVARRLGNQENVEPRILDDLLEFFRFFADRCHHGKEEELLFPLLEKKGMARGGGPIGVMLMEHDSGRDLVRQMSEAAQLHASGNKDAGVRWAAAAFQYVSLLRDHIAKENQVLFVMAERMLSSDEQRDLAEAFERVEVEKMGAGTHESLHAMMERLLTELHTVKR